MPRQSNKHNKQPPRSVIYSPPFNHTRYMKTRFFCLAACAVLFSLSIALRAQTSSQVQNALKNGNADALVQSFADPIDLRLPNNDDTYDKSDAARHLQVFFLQNRPTAFSVKHEGTAPNGAKFIIGTLQTTSGSYRTSLVIRQNQIQELSIEK